MSAGRPLSFAGLVVGYGRQRIAGPLNGQLDCGRVCVLSGANGCGKTTLLRTWIGLLPPLAGRIDGLADRAVSYVPQLAAFDRGFPITCAEVVGTGLPLAAPRRARRERAHAALDSVGLAAAARRSFFVLSGGQRQRVLLARALCADADLVALDEPTAGVDAASSVQVWQAIRSLADLGKLIVVVTHDLFRAPDFADRVLVLDDGQLAERRPEPAR